MIAPSEQPGRNDPCPCGSGKKYKKCCMDDTPSLEAKDMRTLVHIALMAVQKLSRGRALVIPAKTFEDYPKDAKFNAQYDPNTETWRFWVEPPKAKPVIQPSRRIILPRP